MINMYKHILSICLLSLVGIAGSASAATFNNITNEAELRAAIDEINGNEEGDFINLGGRTIVLTSELEINMDSDTDSTLTIFAGTLQRASGAPAFRLVKMVEQNPNNANKSQVVFNSMTLENGLYETANGPANEAGGAAIFSDGVDLDFRTLTFENNMVIGAGTGGAVYLRDASIFGFRADFLNNSALILGGNGATSGGAFGSTNALDITFRDSSFVGNSASRGGAIAPLTHQGRLNVTASTFRDNQADTLGGAIWSRSQTNIQTSTFFNNAADTGGGALYLQPINSSDVASISRNTFLNNSGVNVAGAIYFVGSLSRPDVLGNIIVGNSATPNCVELNVNGPAVFSNDAYNISDDNSCGSATVVGNGTSLLARNFPSFHGGSTFTVELSADSVAIDAGIPQGDALCPVGSIDQRGQPVIGDCDVGSFEFQPVPTDGDNDGVVDANDNCPVTANPDQDDRNENGVGDVCDDPDEDLFFDSNDNCPDLSNPDQINTDGDRQGDACDADDDNDSVPDLEDAFPLDSSEFEDTDNDGLGNIVDLDDDNDGQLDVDEAVCGSDPLIAESTSLDTDGDGIPDCVDDTPFPDADGDGVADADDNCVAIPNAEQEDTDFDEQGNVCDNDDDNDGVADTNDAFPLDSAESVDTDGDSVGNNADTDDDNDNVIDVNDAFPLDSAESVDTDGDGIGNNGDSDDDGDGQSDVHEEECDSNPLDDSSTSPDADGDGIPDCVDDDFILDADGDGVADADDNCVAIPNADQKNTDFDEQGNVCDNDDDNDNVIDANDAFPLDSAESVDTDDDGVGNNADTDDDNDNVIDVNDAFPLDSTESVDTDRDGVGNNADLDDDNDTQLDVNELECGSDPLSAASMSADADGDSIPDCVDGDFIVDADGDGVADELDNCPITSNPAQEDADVDGVGDACDTDTGNNPVTVYQHVNFRGNALSVGEGEVTIGDLRNSPVGNDRISSIEIAPGYSVYACQHSRLRGRCETFTNDTSDLRNIGFNDVISSLVVKLTPVTVYQHVNYRGHAYSVGLGEVTIGDIRRSAVGNDRISSIRIAPGYSVYACQHSRLRGRCETFTNDTPDLRDIHFNDVISSMKVLPAL